MTDLRKKIAEIVRGDSAVTDVRAWYPEADAILALPELQEAQRDAERYVALATLAESVDWTFKRGNAVFRGCRYDNKAQMDAEIDTYIRAAKEEG